MKTDTKARLNRDGKLERGGAGSGKISSILLFAIGILSLAIPALSALLVSTVIPAFHMDGAFQTYSSLLRLADGMLPGKDFYPYLGSGPVLLIFPIFFIHGGSVASSVFASHYVVLLALSISFTLLVTLIAKRSSFQLFMLTWFASSMSIAVLQLAIGSLVNVPQLSDLFAMSEPGNSLRPVRAFLPYIMVLAFLLIDKFAHTLKGRVLMVAALIGFMSAIWSNDYGLVSAFTFLLLFTAKLLASANKTQLYYLLYLWIGSAIFYGLSGSVITYWNFSSLWEYNFVDVRNDQYWYFGPWDDANKINDLPSLLNIIVSENAVGPFALLFLVIVYAWLHKAWNWALIGYIGTTLALGGLVATIGGHAGNYFLPMKVWASFTFFILLSRFLRLIIRKAVGLRPTRLNFLNVSGKRDTERLISKNSFLAMTVFFGLLIGLNGAQNLSEKISELNQDEAYTWNARLGGWIEVNYSYHLSFAPSDGMNLLEEYSGLLTALSGPRTDTKVDSVIHALGSQRKKFQGSLASRPQTVVTSAVEIGPWVTWGLSANWWFYRDLFKHYSPIQTSPLTYIWTEANDRPWPAIPCSIDNNLVSIDIEHTGFYEVKLDYIGPGQGSRTFSMVRNNINMASIGGNGYVALDPAAREQSFPVFVPSNTELPGEFKLDLKNVGPKNSYPVTQLLSCVAAEIVFPEGSSTESLYYPLTPISPSGN